MYFALVLVFVAAMHLCVAHPQNYPPMIMNDTEDLLAREIADFRALEEFRMTNPDWIIEGDIAVDPGRKVAAGVDYWENMTLPYSLDPTLSNEKLTAITAAIAEWEAKTCITFRNVDEGPVFDKASQNSVYITDDGAGCFSWVGRVSRFPQPLNLGTGCRSPDIIIHEIGHALGFYHEHTRSGRDDYVNILTHRILTGRESNFDKRTTNNFNVPYDYFSIMHYPSDRFSIPQSRVNTIQTLDPRYQYIIGTGKVLTFRDEKTANELYCTASYAEACGMPSADVCNAGYLQSDCSCKCPEGTSGNNCEVGTDADPVPCGQNITVPGTYSTPNYPNRASTYLDRCCVWQIQAPADHKIQVFFDDFALYQRLTLVHGPACFWDRAELRFSGVLSEGAFFCGNEMNGRTITSDDSEMSILMGAKSLNVGGRGIRFTVSFTSVTTTAAPTTTTQAPTTTTQAPTTTTQAPTTTTQAPTTTTQAPTTTTQAPTTTTQAPTTTTQAPTTTTQAPTTTTQAPTTTTQAPTTTTQAPTTTTQAPTTTTQAPTTTTQAPTTTTQAPTTTTQAPTATTTEATTTEAPIRRVVCGEVSGRIRLSTGESVEVISPGYDDNQNYPNNCRCVTKIKTRNRGDSLNVTIVDMDLQSHDSCMPDWIILRPFRSRTTLLKTCGTATNEEHSFPNNGIRLKFRSNRAENGRGFLVRFTAVCSA